MKVVFISGLSRAGKAAFWPLLDSVKELDQPQNIPQLDWFNDALISNEITEKAFIKLISLEIRCNSWFSYLGRYLNSNINDLTNFKRLKSDEEFKLRTSRIDNNETFKSYENCIKEKSFIPVYTTDIKLTNQQMKKLGFEIFDIHILRNPIRMYNEWIETKRVRRSKESNSRLVKYKDDFDMKKKLVI